MLTIISDSHNFKAPHFQVFSSLFLLIEESAILDWINVVDICVNFSVMLQTSRQGKLQMNMLKEVITDYSEGKLL